jgi:internalin A
MTLSRRMWLSASFASLLRADSDAAGILRVGGRVDRDSSGAITAIHLGDTFVNDADLLDLLAFRKLTSLDLSHTRISDEGLLRLKPAIQIEDLSLLYAELITDLGINAIKGWGRLKRLNLRGTRVANDALVIVGRLLQLESLDVAYTRITDDGLENLASLTHLRQLALPRTQIGENAIARLGVLSTLQSLDLAGPAGRNPRKGASAPMRDDAVSAIASLQDLRVLKLGYSNIDSRGLASLAVLPKVERLGLECCQRVNDEALQALLNWKRLRFLDVQETEVTQAGVAAFQNSRPGVRILSGPFPAASNSARQQN